MELLQLEYFYAVAQNQHMTRTAEQLHIAQPSLTQSIRRLEKELGVPLFYRSGRNIALTTYGEALQNALTPVLKTLHQIPTQLQQMALEREKTIRLNVLAASTLVTQALISYKKDHDGLHFRLIQNSQCEDADITVFTRETFRSPQIPKNGMSCLRNAFFWQFRTIRPTPAKKASAYRTLPMRISSACPVPAVSARSVTATACRRDLSRTSSMRATVRTLSKT